MKDTHLITTFLSLSKSERRAFKNWVMSPFFNQREDVVLLFQYLNQHVPTGPGKVNEADLEKTKVYPHVFPDAAQQYDDAAMRYVMSFLFQCLKQYLAYTQWTTDEFESGRLLCRALQRRNLGTVFEKEYDALSTRIAGTRLRSVDFFFHQYHLHMERWEVFHRTSRSGTEIMLLAENARDAFIASETLRSACAVLARHGTQQLNSLYLQPTLSGIESGMFRDHPAVLAYYYCYLILENKSDQVAGHFLRLRGLITSHWEIFPPNEIRDLYIGAINFCIRQLNSGDKQYIREALDLYRSGLDRKVILEDGFINKYTYNNIMLLALASEEAKWALEFLETYKSFLPPRDRDNAWRYNLATYYFRNKDYNMAQEILREVEFKDTFYNLDARRMLVRIYMDTGETFALDSLLDSFNIYLQRKRSTLGYHKELNQNFIRFVKNILQLRHADPAAKASLREKITSVKYVA